MAWETQTCETAHRGFVVVHIIEDARIFSIFAAYLTRSCFWAVFLVGCFDIIISFLRVEDFLEPIFGDVMAVELGRSVFRGSYIHYPLVTLLSLHIQRSVHVATHGLKLSFQIMTMLSNYLYHALQMLTQLAFHFL